MFVEIICNHENITGHSSLERLMQNLQHTMFYECVAMDLKKFWNVHLLHLNDYATRVSAWVTVWSKRPEEITEKIFHIWISVYGCPEKFLSDNGGEFSNKAFYGTVQRFISL